MHDIAPNKTVFIETAKAPLTESSIKKLIADNTRPIENPQTEIRMADMEAALSRLQEHQAQQLDMLSELKSASASLKIQVSEHESAIAALGKKLEGTIHPVVVQRDVNSFTAAQIKSRKTELVKKIEPIVVEFPPMRLVSLKNFNGKSAATLTLNGEGSGLVLVGQSWRGFKLIAADASLRSAILARDGLVKNLNL